MIVNIYLNIGTPNNFGYKGVLCLKYIGTLFKQNLAIDTCPTYRDYHGLVFEIAKVTIIGPPVVPIFEYKDIRKCNLDEHLHKTGKICIYPLCHITMHILTKDNYQELQCKIGLYEQHNRICTNKNKLDESFQY